MTNFTNFPLPVQPEKKAGPAQNQQTGEMLSVQEMLDRRNAEFEVIARVAAISNSNASLPDKLTQALQYASSVLTTHYLAVFVNDPDGKPVHTASYSRLGNVEGFHRHCIDRVDLPLLEHAARTKDWIRIPDITCPPVPLTRKQLAAYKRLDVRRIGVKPVISQDKVLGTILLMRHRWVYIPVTEITFMDTFANHIAILIENSRLRRESRDLAIMEERRLLAQELHDSVTQNLFCLDMSVQGLKNSLSNTPGHDPEESLPKPARAALDLIENQTHAIQKALRSLINELRPVELSGEESLDAALKRHISSLQQASGVQILLHIEGDSRWIPLRVQQALNRIAQGALSNIGRHAQAAEAWVRLVVGEKDVDLRIGDNGKGFDPAAVMASVQSYGLTSMSDQARLLGGAFEIVTGPGKGAEVRVSIPIRSEGCAGE